tara:strand:- start:57 stop:416 length:360 start_codon:yes stop_codon:yes gene_type:complete
MEGNMRPDTSRELEILMYLSRSITKDRVAHGMKNGGLRNTREIADQLGLTTSQARLILMKMWDMGIITQYDHRDDRALVWALCFENDNEPDTVHDFKDVFGDQEDDNSEGPFASFGRIG